MALLSMTGFARLDGASGASLWAWEIKSVNAKGLDVKTRLPPGFDNLETIVRQTIASKLSRGSVFVSLAVKRANPVPDVRINEAVLARIVEAARLIEARTPARGLTVDGLLALKGVVELVEPEESEEEMETIQAGLIDGLGRAVSSLVAMREAEGLALKAVLEDRIGAIETQCAAAEANPGRRPEVIKARIAEQIALLLDGAKGFDADRLHQEALMVAAKADIREELDRITAHVAAVRQELSRGGPVGRKLDFLAQELNRETNTLCSKANNVALVAIGLELKALVEQFREQVQNLE